VKDADNARGTIAALSTTRRSARRNKSPKDKEPPQLEDVECVEAGEGGKDSPGKQSEKRTLFASQTEEAPESLRYPESEKSTSEDSVTQGRTELLHRTRHKRQYNGTIDDEKLHRNYRCRR
jgi:hypothetical protein